MQAKIPTYDIDLKTLAARGMLRAVEIATQEKGLFVELRVLSHDRIVDKKLILGHASHVQYWRDNPAAFQKEVANYPSSSAIGRILLGTSLSTASESEWPILRRITRPLLRSDDLEMQSWMVNATSWLLDELASPFGDPALLYECCMSWAVRCISPLFEGFMTNQDILEFLASFRRAYMTLVATTDTIDEQSSKLLPEVKDVRARMDDLVRAAMAAKHGGRIISKLKESVVQPTSDWFAIVLRSVFVGTFVVGADNVGATLVWVLIHLAQSPESVDVIANEALLGCSAFSAVRESLRLTPVAALIERTTVSAIRIGAIDITPGVDVLFVPWLVHRSAEYWESPLEFRVSRFGSRVDSNRAAYFPFGVGARSCVGAELAVRQVALAVSMICKKYRFRLASTCRPGDLVPTFGINLLPRGRVEMIFDRRKP